MKVMPVDKDNNPLQVPPLHQGHKNEDSSSDES